MRCFGVKGAFHSGAITACYSASLFGQYVPILIAVDQH